MNMGHRILHPECLKFKGMYHQDFFTYKDMIFFAFMSLYACAGRNNGWMQTIFGWKVFTTLEYNNVNITS